jgi:hypothetical protein
VEIIIVDVRFGEPRKTLNHCSFILIEIVRQTSYVSLCTMFVVHFNISWQSLTVLTRPSIHLVLALKHFKCDNDMQITALGSAMEYIHSWVIWFTRQFLAYVQRTSSTHISYWRQRIFKKLVQWLDSVPPPYETINWACITTHFHSSDIMFGRTTWVVFGVVNSSLQTYTVVISAYGIRRHLR